MNKKYLWNLLAIMMVAMMSVSFVSCGDDDEPEPLPTPTPTPTPEQKNADLIGWWKEPDNSSGYYTAMGDDYWSSRHALHFINANTVEEAWVVKTEQVTPSSDFYGRDSWKDAFSGWYYFTAFDYYTWVYERKDNVITLQRSSELYTNNNIVIVDNKLRWGSVEYEKITDK